MIEIAKKQVVASNIWAEQQEDDVLKMSSISMLDKDNESFIYKTINEDLSETTVQVVSLQKDADAQLSNDVVLHLEFYKKYPAIRSLAHVFTPKLMNFSLVGEAIPVYSKQHAIYHSSEIKCAIYQENNHQSLIEIIAHELQNEEITSKGIVLLYQNGAFIWDETPIKTLESALHYERIADYAWCLQSRTGERVKSISAELIDSYIKEQRNEEEKAIQPGEPGTMVTKEQLKAINLGMLEFFDRVCRENGIKYSLTGGTLLGAIRHGGMIPWDDDVDVFLTRPEYEKLTSIFPDNDQFELLTMKKDPTFNYVFGRVIDKRTIVKYSPNTAAAGRGLSLDVCVIDGLPKSARKRIIHQKYMRLLVRLRRATIQDPHGKRYTEKGLFVVFLKRVLCKLTSISFWNRRIAKAMDKYKFDESDYVGNFTSQYGSKELLHRKAFDKYYDVPFENLTCMIYSGYDEYLSNIYKDYLAFPPKNKQVGHHICNAFWI